MPRMLVVVAHPDDETFGMGSCIAHAAASGVDVTVCCATRGEAGEDMSGTTSSREELALVREAELRDAAAILGARDVVVLDFGDSDLNGVPLPGTIMQVPMADIVEPIAALIEALQPDVVVTMDPDSVVDHRDHARIGEVTTIAFAQTAKQDARLYHWTLARGVMSKWFQAMRDMGRLEAYEDNGMGRAEDEITTVVDVTNVLEVRCRAIAAHHTQTSPFDGLEKEFRDTLLAQDHFVRAVPPWTGGDRESSLWG
jgi:LmbE family N-acetylglucosaminyl deacetylase